MKQPTCDELSCRLGCREWGPTASEDNGIDWVDFHLYGDIIIGSISCAILISDGDLPAR